MAKFRETLWFKRGDTGEQPVVDETAASDRDRPVEDRYEDDGSVTQTDRAAYSVHTGHTEHIPLVKRKVAEDVAPQLIAELAGGRRRVVAAIGAGFAMLGVIVVFYMS